jgi:hypothetical protein
MDINRLTQEYEKKRIVISPYEVFILFKYGTSKHLEQILTLLNNYRREIITRDEYFEELNKLVEV